jgi:hypothetical protein
MTMYAVALAGVALVLAACQPVGDVGYVEIRTVPVLSNVTGPPLYLGTFKVDPPKKGNAVLTQRVGTLKLATDGAGGQLLLCEIAVKKNRITTVTVSVLERPPRCHCRNNSADGANRVCVS